MTTFHAVSFSLVGDPIATNDHTLQLVFTQAIDPKKTQITLLNTKTKKVQTIDHIENSKDDFRSITIILKKKLETGAQYDMTLKKVFSQAGFEMPAENKTVLKVVYSGDIGQVILPPAVPTPPTPPAAAVDANTAPSAITADNTTDQTAKSFDKPVPTDRLPQTGPEEMLGLLLLSLFAAFVIQKKLHKGA